jgi:anti-anti-sigma factor
VAITDLRAEVSAAPDGALVLALEGDLDMHSEHLVASWVSAFQAEASYVIDLSRVTMIDTSGLNGLVKAQAIADHRRAKLVLRAPTKQALDLLMLTGLDLHFTIT